MANAEPWTSPEGTMVNELFKSLDAEFVKLDKKGEDEKRDVFSRVFGRGSKALIWQSHCGII